MEFVIALIIACTAGFALYKNIKGNKSGGCNCGSCSSHCPVYDQKVKNKS